MPAARSLYVDLAVYSLDCIKRSAFRFTDRFAVDLSVDGSTAECTLIFDQHISDEVADLTVAAFRKELLDQDLRSKIWDETKMVRNLILSHAFSRTGLIGDDPFSAD